MKTGWKLNTLGSISTVFADGDWIESKDQSSDGIRLVQTGNVGSGYFKDRSEKARYVSDATFKRLRCTEIFEGDCLISRLPDPIGRACLLPETGERMITAVDCTIIRFDNNKVLPQFFNYYSQSHEYIHAVLAQATGTTRNRISRNKLSEVQIPTPPISVQQRIVTILDEAFEGITVATANAEKNLINARELFESHLQSVFSNPTSGWKPTTLGAEVDLSVGFAFKSSKYTEHEQDIRLLRGDNIVQGALRWDDVKRWSASDLDDYEKYRLNEGDIVLAMDRPWVKAGLKRAQITSSDLPCLLVQRTARLRGNKDMNNEFLLHLINSRAFVNHILGVQTGIGVPHISGQQIKDFEFLKPPLKRQIEISEQLDLLDDNVRSLESVYEQKLGDLAELKKSILHRAFTGQLH